ncbi:MAG: TonB-dependent receptor [Calditrichaeota bacterium]|nr:MAG: TonB-dependent receptor [Calditrichota bacterium]
MISQTDHACKSYEEEVKMKHPKLYIFVMVLAIIIALPGSIFAQKGMVTGQVIDAETSDPLPGANVVVVGTNVGTAANIDGYFTLNLAPGTYDILCSMIGYEKQIELQVIVNTNISKEISFRLKMETIEGEEVVVEAQVERDNSAILLRDRKKAEAVSDAISAEDMSQSGAGDAAAAMKKVTGASVVDGKYVYIRGLGDRYAATTLNGAELPSADPDKQSFQLDLIPSNMLNNINTIKTFTPDKPGTFTGGLVDVTTKNYPQKLTIQMSTSSGYNSVTTGNDNFIQPNSGGHDWLAMDDGSRELPSIFGSSPAEIPTPRDVENLEQALYLDEASKSFSNVMMPIASSAGINSSMGFSLGNTLFFDEAQNHSIGFFGSLKWGQQYSFYENGETGRFKLVGDLEDVEALTPEFTGEDKKGTRDISWGSIANLAYKNNTFGHIKFSYMRTQSAESMARYLEGYRASDRTSSASTRTFETRVLSWTERGLNSYQLEGDHKVSSVLNMNIDWQVALAENDQIEPDQRYFFNIYDINEDGEYLYGNDLANSQSPQRYYRDLNEKTRSGQFNLNFPFKQWNGFDAKFKTGFSGKSITRSYDQRRFEYDTSNLSYRQYGPDVDTYFAQVGIVDSVSSSRYRRWYGLTINEKINPSNFFDGDADVTAAYAMIDLPLTSKLRFIGGARIEKSLMNSRTENPDDGAGNLKNTDVLPSINFIYAPQDNMNLRIAATQTVARPTFRELAPYQSFEFVGDFIYRGNTELSRTLIQNYDIRWEWFQNPGEVLAVSGFFKNFNDPLEPFLDPRGASGDDALQSIQNVDNARVLGVELEAKKALGFINSNLKNFHLGTNLSIVGSEVDIPQAELEEIRAQGDPNAESTRPFTGQSPYLLNVNMVYKSFSHNNSAGLFYNVFGDRLYLVATAATPDIYERAYGTLDFKGTLGITRNINLSLTAKNLLNRARVFSYQLENDQVNEEFIYQKYKRGTTIGISLDYKL